jgi:hypothetical protein
MPPRTRRTRPDQEHFGEAVLGAGQSQHPGIDPEMIEPDADPLDTSIEDADFFLGWDDDEPEPPHATSS